MLDKGPKKYVRMFNEFGLTSKKMYGIGFYCCSD